MYEHEREQDILQSRAELSGARELLRVAQPDGTKCQERACPFLALVEGRCRQHYLERFTTHSMTGSSAAIAMTVSIY